MAVCDVAVDNFSANTEEAGEVYADAACAVEVFYCCRC